MHRDRTLHNTYPHPRDRIVVCAATQEDKLAQRVIQTNRAVVPSTEGGGWDFRFVWGGRKSGSHRPDLIKSVLLLWVRINSQSSHSSACPWLASGEAFLRRAPLPLALGGPRHSHVRIEA